KLTGLLLCARPAGHRHLTIAAKSAGAMLPPDSTTAVRPAAPTTPDSSAASGTAPLGSTTIFSRSKQNRIASTTASSVTVTTSLSNRELTANVSSPGEVALSPSARVSGSGIVTRCPARIDYAVSPAGAGSTPIT